MPETLEIDESVPDALGIGPAAPRLLSNVTANVATFVLSVVAGIFLVPYMVKRLGVEGYGTVALAVQLSAYVGVFGSALSITAARELAFEYARQHRPGAVARAVFLLSLGLAAVVAVLAWPAALAATALTQVPEALTGEARILFALVFLSIAGTLLRLPQETAAYAQNRLGVRGSIQALELAVRVVAIVAIFELAAPSVRSVGGAYALAALVAAAGAALIAKRFLVQPVKTSAAAGPLARKIFSTSLWVLVNAAGALLFLNVDILIANLVLGATVAGRYAAILPWSNLLRALAMAVSGAFGPPIHALVARELQVWPFLSKACYAVGCVIAVIAGIIVAVPDTLLAVWLGPGFSDLAPILVLMVVTLPMTLSAGPMAAAQLAAGQVRVPAVATLLFGVVNVGLAAWLGQPHRLGLQGIVIAGIFALFLKNVVFMPAYLSLWLKGAMWTSYATSLMLVLAATVATAACAALAARLPPSTWHPLLRLSIAAGAGALGGSLAGMAGFLWMGRTRAAGVQA